MPGDASGGQSHDVRLTSSDRVLFPDDGVTKGDLFAYYDAVADALVPHLRDRPFTMKRYREGIAAPAFFQKQAPKGMPSWIATRQFPTRTREGRSRLVDFPLVNSREALLWMVQMHCIDMNTWYSRVDEPERPDYVVFDLDPPDGDFALGVGAARLVGNLMTEIGLRAYPKASGADGMHVFVPIERRHSFGDAHAFAESAARLLETRHPGVVTTEWIKAKRNGVLIDYHQNGLGRTTASVYSVRPRQGATVSMPLRWEELEDGLDRRTLTIDATLRRIKEEDLFAPVLAGGQSLQEPMRKLAASIGPRLEDDDRRLT
jgi:bifunctional non-homologous end joining protein LigD